MRLLKKSVLVVYVLMMVVMALATIIENVEGTLFVARHIYGAWWFSLLWAVLAALGVAYIFVRKVRRWCVLLLHLSLLVILIGALITHLTSYSGTIVLQQGKPANAYTAQTPTGQLESHPLPFSVTLRHFQIMEYPGTRAASDYLSRFTITDGGRNIEGQVSMNKIFTYRGLRFYQAGYGPDGLSSTLAISSDPWGIPVSYTGYALLFFGLLGILADPKGTFRKRMRQLSQSRMAAVALVLGMLPQVSVAQTTVPESTAKAFGKLFINYGDRICPMETYGLDFLQKIYGKHEYKGRTALQVLMSWTFFPDDWDKEPILHLKNKAMRHEFSLPEYASVGSFFRNGDYVLGPYIYAYTQGQHDALHKACADIDGRLQVIMALRTLRNYTCFPYTSKTGVTTWYSPADSYPASMPADHARFMRSIFPYLLEEMKLGHYDSVNEALSKIGEYQQKNGGSSVPIPSQVWAEHVYNALPFTTLLFVLNLSLGFLSLVVFVWHQGRRPNTTMRRVEWGTVELLALSFLALTAVVALRWEISGRVPLSNGYETMIAMAWLSQCASLTFILTKGYYRLVAPHDRSVIGLSHPDVFSSFLHAYSHAPRALTSIGLIMCVFGFLLAGFFLLESHLGVMDPAIGPLMPVLNSPLLSVHVSVVMLSYAFLAITFLCGVMGLFMKRLSARLQVLSQVFLYPAVATLGVGIFLGAVWANVSWGSYWSWDPKETWALITFMLYAVALHTQSFPLLMRPRAYHAYMVMCFLSIVMTYFGVNYFLTGMHSYA